MAVLIGLGVPVAATWLGRCLWSLRLSNCPASSAAMRPVKRQSGVGHDSPLPLALSVAA